MAKKYIHVNQHKIKANLKHGTNEPVITVKEGKSNRYGHAVDILGPSRVVYGRDGLVLLPCGARVVIETEAEVIIHNDAES
jgi:hypothetical protein